MAITEVQVGTVVSGAADRGTTDGASAAEWRRTIARIGALDLIEAAVGAAATGSAGADAVATAVVGTETGGTVVEGSELDGAAISH
jgi:hypothetical protein